MTSSIFPIDIDGVKRIGVDNWINGDLPPNPAVGEYRKIYDIVSRAFWEPVISVEENRELRYVAAVNYKIVALLSSHILKLTSLKKIKSMGFDAVCGNHNLEINELMNQPCSHHIFDSYIINLDINNKGVEALKQIKQNLIFGSYKNILFPWIPSLAHAGNLFIIGDPNQKEIAKFIESIQNVPKVIRPHLLFNNYDKFDIGDNNSLVNEYSNNLFESIAKYIPETRTFLDSRTKKNFSELINRSLNLIRNIRNKLKDLNKAKLLVAPHGNLAYRTLAAAWRMANGTTTAFTHGNNYWGTYLPGSDLSNGSFEIFDELIVFSKGEKALVGKARADQNNIFHVPREVLIDVLYKPSPINSGFKTTKVNDVFYVGFPMDYTNYYCFPSHHTLTYLKFEISVLKTLKQLGYRVFYKAHPDTLSEISGLYDNLCDKILTGKFEDVYGGADCVVFGTPFSTTFGFTLLSSKPMLLFNNLNEYQWNSERFSLISKRVAMVDISLDGHGSLIYDTEAVNDAIIESPGKIDHSIINRLA